MGPPPPWQGMVCITIFASYLTFFAIPYILSVCLNMIVIVTINRLEIYNKCMLFLKLNDLC